MGLSELRKEVQKIDEEIVGLVERRVSLAERIMEAKVRQGLDIEDPGQEKLVLRRAADMAGELGLDHEAMEEIFHLLIAMSRERQRDLLEKRYADPETANPAQKI